MLENSLKKVLESGLQSCDIQLSEEQLRAMMIHADELLKWNRKTNLTAITQPDEMIEKHYIDSILGTIGLDSGSRILDIGSGGGFPGIPLKIFFPDIDILLLDASRKKISFLKHVIRILGLKQIEAIHSRAQDLCREKRFNHQFDIVISRAFSNLAQFIELGSPFLSSNGFLFALKGKNFQAELEPINKKLFTIDIHSYVLPFTKAQRHIIKIKPNS